MIINYSLLLVVCIVGVASCDSKLLAGSNKNDAAPGCAMYGLHPSATIPGTLVPIAERTEPKELDQQGVELLKEMCPFLAGPLSKSDKKIKTCCNKDHLAFFRDQSMPLNTLISGCPSCKMAMLTYGCNMICNPYQSSYLEVTETTKADNLTLVSAFTMSLSEKYINNIFNTCKDYKMVTGQSFVQTVLCSAASDTAHCNATVMMNFMQDNVNGMTAKNIYVKEGATVPSNVTPVNSWVPSCDKVEKVNGVTVERCSCKDCAYCKWNVAFSHSPPGIHVGKITLWQFIFFLLAGMFVFVMIVGGTVVLLRRKHSLARTPQNSMSSVLDVCQHSSLDNLKNNDANKIIDDQELLSDEIDDGVHVTVFSPYTSENWLNKILGKISFFVVQLSVKHTLKVIGFFLVLCIVLSSCIPFAMKITSNPVELWSSPGSQIFKNMKNYESKFGKFYRTEQLVISNTKNGTGITLDMITFVDSVVSHLENLKVPLGDAEHKLKSPGKKFTTLADFCVKPLHPTSNACVIYSIMQYFRNDLSLLNKFGDKWKDHLKKCFNSPGFVPADSDKGEIACLPTFLQPIDPWLVVGDFVGVDYLAANTLVITFVVENPKEESRLKEILLWEKEFIKYASQLAANHIKLYNISFSSERSIEDEVTREAKYNVKIVLISYLVMFFYVSFSLGKLPRSVHTFFVDSKFVLGFCGVLLVFLSVTTSIGLLSLCGVKLNSIALEVLPFLILAIGVDNMFIISHSYYRIIENHEDFGLGVDSADLDVDNCVTMSFLKVGPSIMISAVSQVIIFSLGTISAVPVVRTFSIFASVALLINFLLQLTVFLSLFVLDSRREMSGRLNLCCSFKSGHLELPAVGEKARYFMGPARWVVKNVLGTLLMNKFTRFTIVVLFGTLWLLSLAAIPSINIGLDQTLALPKDSYLQPYFNDLLKKLHFGAPVYFVIGSGYDYQNVKQQDLICASSFCDIKSMCNYVAYWSQKPNVSRIAAPLMSWLDGYFQWLSGQRMDKKPCCNVVVQVKNQTKYPNLKVGDFCTHEQSLDVENITCEICINKESEHRRPDGEQFAKLLPYFLDDVPDTKSCSVGGKSAFKNSVILNKNYYKNSTSNHRTAETKINPIITSSFMTYHTPLVTTDDFIHAIKNSMEMAKNITSIIGTSVYPYSVFYIFYEAFLDIRATCYKSLGICCIAVVLASLFLHGFNVRMTLVISLTVIFMNVVNLAFLYVGQMEINPVSIVNLIMLFAINIEFVSHIAFAYMSCGGDSRLSNAYGALITSGGSVFSGIALTKIIGISVLAFASSEIFKIYYFRMYMFAVVVGALHGLIFLPAILSYLGPKPIASLDFERE